MDNTDEGNFWFLWLANTLPPFSLTSVFMGLFLTLFLHSSLCCVEFFPYLNTLFQRCHQLCLLVGLFWLELALSITGRPLAFSHRGHTWSPAALPPILSTHPMWDNCHLHMGVHAGPGTRISDKYNNLSINSTIQLHASQLTLQARLKCIYT